MAAITSSLKYQQKEYVRVCVFYITLPAHCETNGMSRLQGIRSINPKAGINSNLFIRLNISSHKNSHQVLLPVIWWRIGNRVVCYFAMSSLNVFTHYFSRQTKRATSFYLIFFIF